MAEEDYFKMFDLEVLDYPKIVKSIREMEGISTHKLADKLGVSQSSITRIERNMQKPREKMRKKLFDLFSSKLAEEDPVEDIIKTNPDQTRHLAAVGYWASIILSYTKTDKIYGTHRSPKVILSG